MSKGKGRLVYSGGWASLGKGNPKLRGGGGGRLVFFEKMKGSAFLCAATEGKERIMAF